MSAARGAVAAPGPALQTGVSHPSHTVVTAESPAVTASSPGPVAVMVLVDIAPGSRAWGYGRFVFGRFALQRVPGLHFFKVLGSGYESGFEAKGWPVATFVRGIMVMCEAQLVHPGRGKPVSFVETLPPEASAA